MPEIIKDDLYKVLEESKMHIFGFLSYILMFLLVLRKLFHYFQVKYI